MAMQRRAVRSAGRRGGEHRKEATIQLEGGLAPGEAAASADAKTNQ